VDRGIPLPPRRVYRRRGLPPLLRVVLLCLVPHVWAGVLMLYWGIVGIALNLGGHHVTATVTLLDTVQSKGTHYRVTYTYPAGSAAHVGNDQIKFDEWRQLKVGQTLGLRAIDFLGSHRSRIDDPRIKASGGGACCFLPFALLWNGLMCGIFVTWVGPVWRRRWLAKRGVPAMGRLTMKNVKVEKKNKTYTLGYTFSSWEGLPQVGTMKVNALEFAEMREGQLLPVLYDPVRPHRSMIYGLGEYAAADDRGDELVFDQRT
jgi:hypothetical protein